MKLIITDLDNTLLRNDKSISQYTVNVLEQFRAKGYFIAFASARAENAMTRFIKAIKPDIIISNGGATISFNGEIIYRNRMAQDDVARIVKMCRQFTNNEGRITVECDDGYYCNFTPSDPDRRAAFTFSDFEDFKTPAYKITAELEKDVWVDEIVRACPDCTAINFTGEKWRRVAARNSDKGTALRMLVKHIGVDLLEVIAFGDDINDLEMLKSAGLSVAVSNAADAVKAAADHIAESNDEDGVARYLAKIFL